MLQQTQVERVQEKYRAFIAAFPDLSSLSRAPLKDVLSIWQGLGYNRRAIALQRTAQEVIEKNKGGFPSSVDALMQFPGIGRATASAIAAFAFNRPVVFLETNIRRVFIHFFFQEREDVRDVELLPLVEEALDLSNPREWYYALMDYGSMLKKAVPNPNRKSVHYQRQAPFEGSQRQLRGLLLRNLLQSSGMTKFALRKMINKDPEKIKDALKELEEEGFIRKNKNTYSIA